MKYRFLDEYANHKKRQAKLYSSSKEDLRMTTARVDRILLMAHRGQILLDEAMRLLSEI